MSSTIRPRKFANFYFQRRHSRNWFNNTSRNDLSSVWKNFLVGQQLRNEEPRENIGGCIGPASCGLPNENRAEERMRQVFIESFKKRLLEHMNLPEVPHVNESAWYAVPFVIQQRLKAKIDVNNRVTEGPPVDNEEKEAIFLLQPDVYTVQSVSFNLSISEPMDDRQIVYGHIHAENMDGIPSHMQFAIWEIIPSWSESVVPEQGDDDGAAEFSKRLSPFLVPVVEQATLIQPVIAVSSAQEIYNYRTITFDITRRLKKWIKLHNRKQNGDKFDPLVKNLLLVCHGCSGADELIDSKKVVLDVRYSPALRRRRRSVGIEHAHLMNRCQKGGHQFTCCTEPLVIKFSEIGWDNWIVFPDRVEANYCRGTCQLHGLRSAHYEMLNLLQEANKSRIDGSPSDTTHSCCYPTRRNDFSILHLDSNEKINMLTLHGLIVLGCGCS